MSKAVPAALIRAATAETKPGTTPTIEVKHVHKVYDVLATQWAGTRYKAWPAVEAFLDAYAHRSFLIGEFGCGNGKNLQAAAAKGCQVIASDICVPLCEIASMQTKMADVHVADITCMPLKSNMFDLVVCVAVLHHLSTWERRKQAVSECARTLVPGGRALFLAWAQDQTNGYSGHEFPSQDVFVPFHQRVHLPGFVQAFKPHPDDVSKDLMHGVFVEEKRSIVYQRYCHVFAQGEIESLVHDCGLRVLRSFEDTGNWAVECEKPL